jgi:hypothetical protein
MVLDLCAVGILRSDIPVVTFGECMCEEKNVASVQAWFFSGSKETHNVQLPA